MGGVRKAQIFNRCPWGIVLTDPLVPHFLSAYGLIDRWREWPPGKRDPRLVSALTIIGSEHNRITAESLAKK
jgi:hypothetical protein